MGKSWSDQENELTPWDALALMERAGPDKPRKEWDHFNDDYESPFSSKRMTLALGLGEGDWGPAVHKVCGKIVFGKDWQPNE